MISEETAPDLVARTREVFDIASRGDFDSALTFFARDSVWDGTQWDFGTFAGHAAIRAFWQDWFDAYEELVLELVEAHDFGNGVVLGEVKQEGRPARGEVRVQQREMWLYTWQEGLVTRVTTYRYADEARAAAERLAKERG